MKQPMKSSKLFFLAFVFCMALALTLVCLLPVSAAEEPEIAWGASADDLTGSGTLYDAMVAAYDGTGVYFRLQKDITLDSFMEQWTLTGVITLDLNGHTLTSPNGFGVIGGGLILEDSVGGGVLAASDGAALYISTSSSVFSSVTVKGGTLTGKQAIRAYSPCEFHLEGGTLSGSTYGDVHISSADAKVVVTGSTFTSSVAAFAYGTGGEIDLADAAGDTYTVNVIGSMMATEMATDKVILPEGFSLYGDDGAEITDAAVPVGKIVTAKKEVPAGGTDTDNTGGTPDTDAPGNTGNSTGSADDGGSDALVVILIIVIVVILAGVFVFLFVYKKKKDKTE